MSRIIILGASGSLGRHVAEAALASGHEVSVVVRTPGKLPASWRDRVRIHQADLMSLPAPQLAALVSGHDALINTAGMVSDGDTFVALVDHIVTSIEQIEPARRPVCWLLAGAGLLDIADTGRRGLDLPGVRKTYWPHGRNFERLKVSTLDWRLLCPGPMVEGPGVGLGRLRVSLDQLPVSVPTVARRLPGVLLVPLFASRIPEMIVPYIDAAALMLNNLGPGGAMSRHRVGLALPLGMRGKKPRWSARPPGN
jgi:hypothetical protein